jgi:hypothetical protein
VRLANALVTGTLFVAVMAEGAYIVKTHRQIEKLTTQVEQLAADSVDDVTPREQGRSSAGVGQRPTTTAAAAAGRLPPPRFNAPPPSFNAPPAAPGAAPLPPALDTPEAREQLRNFVAAEMQTQREAWRQQQIEGRDEENRRRLDNAIKTLGLSESDGRKLTDIVTQSQSQREAMREKIQSGQIPREQVAQSIMALRDSTNKQIQALVGDEKAQKFQELQRQNRGPGGPPGLGGGRGGFGGPGVAGGQRPAQP